MRWTSHPLPVEIRLLLVLQHHRTFYVSSAGSTTVRLSDKHALCESGLHDSARNGDAYVKSPCYPACSQVQDVFWLHFCGAYLYGRQVHANGMQARTSVGINRTRASKGIIGPRKKLTHGLREQARSQVSGMYMWAAMLTSQHIVDEHTYDQEKEHVH